MSKALAVTASVYMAMPKWLRTLAAGFAGFVSAGVIGVHF